METSGSSNPTIGKGYSPIGSSLINSGILTVEELEQFSEMARTKGEPLWEVLLRENKITEAWLADALGQYLHLPLVNVGTLTVDPETVQRIPQNLARAHQCFPYAQEGRFLKVAFVDPSDLASIQTIEFSTGSRIQAAVGLRSHVLEAIDRNYSQTQVGDIIGEAGDQADLQIFSSSEDVDLDETSSRRAAATPPIIKLVNLVIAEALRVKASDIHIEPSEDDIRIRLRVDGVLRDFLQAPAFLRAGLSTRLKVLAKLDIAEKRVPQDGRFKVRYQQKTTDMRVSTLPTQFGEKAVLRVLGSSEGIPPLEQLGIPAADLPTILEAAHQPQGMIIVTGPTGSGKTTTLYSLLKHNRTPQVNVVTVEDPIEYQLEGANQVQVNPKTGLTFATCLRSILRQDPDTILVGEIRDEETVETAFHAAMTGHLVLTTLHTNNSVATVLRLLDLGVDPFVITSSVVVIVAQRLVRVACDQCRQIYTPAPRLLQRLGWKDRGFTFIHGVGCKACHGSGFKGRRGVYEILRMSLPVRKAINERASEVTLRKAAVKSGMVPLLQGARELIRMGETTPEEVIRSIQLTDEESASCARCGGKLSLRTGRCAHCEGSRALPCVSCGLALDPTWIVCPQCSTPALRVEKPSGKGLKAELREALQEQKKGGTIH